MLFRRLVLWALLVGAVSGLVLSAVQFWQVIPIIHQAERFEHEAPAGNAHEHEGHEHGAGAWAPAEGAERVGFTLLSNVLTAAGFAMVMLAAMVASRRGAGARGTGWLYGLLWGAAGYAVFFVAPSLGMPPEIPGAAAAPLADRQLWWLFAVVCTAVGLAGAVFGKSPWRWLALVLIVVPHVVGAPNLSTGPFSEQPAAAAAELEQLAHSFIGATALANAVLWATLGLASAWAMKKILSPTLTN